MTQWFLDGLEKAWTGLGIILIQIIIPVVKNPLTMSADTIRQGRLFQKISDCVWCTNLSRIKYFESQRLCIQTFNYKKKIHYLIAFDKLYNPMYFFCKV